MKSVIAALFLSSLAFAGPKVGNMAEFDVVSELDGQTATAIVKIEITNFNASTNQYLQKYTVTNSRGSESHDSWLEEGSFLSDAQVADFLANCVSYGGTMEKLALAGGSFDTCALPFDDQDSSGSVWVANIPYGFVKELVIDKTNGLKSTATLRAFR